MYLHIYTTGHPLPPKVSPQSRIVYQKSPAFHAFSFFYLKVCIQSRVVYQKSPDFRFFYVTTSVAFVMFAATDSVSKKAPYSFNRTLSSI